PQRGGEDDCGTMVRHDAEIVEASEARRKISGRDVRAPVAYRSTSIGAVTIGRRRHLIDIEMTSFAFAAVIVAGVLVLAARNRRAMLDEAGVAARGRGRPDAHVAIVRVAI